MDPGDWTIDDSNGFCEAVINTEGLGTVRISVADLIAALTDDQRENILGSWCSGCGGPNPCHCQNDE